jgi:hypothetical protein
VTLAQHISASPSTIENWVSAGAPCPSEARWKTHVEWSEVDARLSEGSDNGLVNDEEMRDAVRREREAERRNR